MQGKYVDPFSLMVTAGGAAALTPLAAAAFGGGWLAAVIAAAACVGIAFFAATKLRDAVARFGKDSAALAGAEQVSVKTVSSLEGVYKTLQGALETRGGDYVSKEALAGSEAPFLLADERGVVLTASRGMGRLVGDTAWRLEGREAASLLGVAAGELVGLRGAVVSLDGTETQCLASAGTLETPEGRVTMVTFAEAAAVLRERDALAEQSEKLMASGGEMSELAQRVASASEELSASADEQARGAQQQKDQSDSVATAMEEMTATVLEVAQNASATSEAATQARDAAQEGVSLVGKAVQGINDVSNEAATLSEVLEQLDAQSAQIGRIINVINDIADQTNLLALNAAIEAARAGEAGRGFAVVADEVRKLAEKTMTATKEVEEAISTIQRRSQEAMRSMKSTAAQVDDSTQLSNQAGEALKQIMVRIEDMVQRVAQIATAAEEQSASAEEINKAIEEISFIARESDEGAEQAAYATRELAELSQSLLNLAVSFSGHADATAKFWKSKGQMRGVLPKMMQDFAKKAYGQEAYQKMQRAMGDPVFLPGMNYPDQVLKQMAHELGEATGKSPKAVFADFGRYTVPQFHKMYRRYFKADNLKDLYLAMDTIHAQLTKDYPGIHPPRFTYQDKGDTLVMTYKSERGLFDYFEGIIHGAAEYFKEPVKVNVTPVDDRTARAEIRFQ